MFDDITNDVAKEIADAIVLKYSSHFFATQEEMDELRKMANSVAIAKITEAFKNFCNI